MKKTIDAAKSRNTAGVLIRKSINGSSPYTFFKICDCFFVIFDCCITIFLTCSANVLDCVAFPEV